MSDTVGYASTRESSSPFQSPWPGSMPQSYENRSAMQRLIETVNLATPEQRDEFCAVLNQMLYGDRTVDDCINFLTAVSRRANPQQREAIRKLFAEEESKTWRVWIVPEGKWMALDRCPPKQFSESEAKTIAGSDPNRYEAIDCKHLEVEPSSKPAETSETSKLYHRGREMVDMLTVFAGQLRGERRGHAAKTVEHACEWMEDAMKHLEVLP